jgi:hypothetical protein
MVYGPNHASELFEQMASGGGLSLPSLSVVISY